MKLHIATSLHDWKILQGEFTPEGVANAVGCKAETVSIVYNYAPNSDRYFMTCLYGPAEEITNSVIHQLSLHIRKIADLNGFREGGVLIMRSK